jgi:hypothetical protein
MGTLVSVASLLPATLYQVNPDRKHKLRNIGSPEIYLPYADLLECASYKWKVQNGKI